MATFRVEGFGDCWSAGSHPDSVRQRLQPGDAPPPRWIEPESIMIKLTVKNGKRSCKKELADKSRDQQKWTTKCHTIFWEWTWDSRVKMRVKNFLGGRRGDVLETVSRAAGWLRRCRRPSVGRCAARCATAGRPLAASAHLVLRTSKVHTSLHHVHLKRFLRYTPSYLAFQSKAPPADRGRQCRSWRAGVAYRRDRFGSARTSVPRPSPRYAVPPWKWRIDSAGRLLTCKQDRVPIKWVPTGLRKPRNRQRSTFTFQSIIEVRVDTRSR